MLLLPIVLTVFNSISKNPICDDGFGAIMDSLIKNPKSSLQKLGYVHALSVYCICIMITCHVSGA